MQYRTKEGDVVDAICYREYSNAALFVQVYEANPGLVDYGPVLPGGLLIELPDISVPDVPELPKISLFD